jgi:predicted Zn-dependent peptidase
MGIWVTVGSRDEAAHENGLSHFIEHMLFKGTDTRSAFQIAREFDAIGGHSNAFTSSEYTCYHAWAIDSHVDIMADLLSDILLHSTFSDQEIMNERPVVLSEVSMIEDSPEEYVHTLFEENYFRGHALGRPILGTPETIETFDSRRIRDYFSRHYQPGRIIISAAGNLSHDRFVDRVGPIFESLTAKTDPLARLRPDPVVHTRVYPKDQEQVHLCLGNRGLALTDPDRFCGSLLNTLLGGNMSSRLFQEIREKRGLAYAIYSFTALNMDAGLSGIYTAVAPEDVIPSLSLILKELGTLCARPIPVGELDDAKEYIKANILLSAESTESQMLRMAQNEIHYGRDMAVSEVVDKIQSVTVDDILALARRQFNSQRPSLTVLGPFDRPSDLDTLIDEYDAHGA